MIKLSLANNEIGSFACAINQARGTCWARDRARLTEIPAYGTCYEQLKFLRSLTGNMQKAHSSVYRVRSPSF